jgi:Mrp family chromosome partitioning ATPase
MSMTRRSVQNRTGREVGAVSGAAGTDELSSPPSQKPALPEKVSDRFFTRSDSVRRPRFDAAVRQLLSRRDLVEMPDRIGVVGPRSGVGVSTVVDSLAHVLTADFGARVCRFDLSNSESAEDSGRGSVRAVLPSLVAAKSELARTTDRRVSSLRLEAVSDDEWHELVRSDDFALALAALDELFDVVVLDLPPMLDGNRSQSVVQRVDGAVLVARHRSTSLADISTTRQELRDQDVVGVVLNRYRSRVPKVIGRRFGIG